MSLGGILGRAARGTAVVGGLASPPPLRCYPRASDLSLFLFLHLGTRTFVTLHMYNTRGAHTAAYIYV